MEVSTRSDGSSSGKPAVRHSSLYFDDETVVIRVEDTFYRVHRHFLRTHSTAFEGMFTVPQGRDKQEEGLNDEHPIHLKQVKSIDFERLLSLFYPKNIKDGDLSTVAEWTSVLALATQFMFDAHRDLAISRLSQLASPVDRVILARTYDVTQWLAPAYLELCKRDAPLTLEEGLRLGMKDVIMLSDIRQFMRCGNAAFRTPPADRTILNLITTKML